MLEVLFLKCKPLPIDKRRPFFFLFFFLNSFENDPFSWGCCVYVDGFKRPLRSEKNLHGCLLLNVLPLDVENLILQLPPYVSACD